MYKRRDVTFNESDFGDEEVITLLDGEDARKENPPNYDIKPEADQLVKNEKPTSQLERPKRETKMPGRYGYEECADPVVTDAELIMEAMEWCEPKTLEEALSSDGTAKWEEAAIIGLLNISSSWTTTPADMVKLPLGRNSIGCKWVFKVKHSEDGSVEKFNGRLVAKGFVQEYGVDYDGTFSSTVKFTTMLGLISLAAEKKMHLRQVGVVSAFLNGELEEEIYMNQPESYVQQRKEDLVCRLRKPLHGLKQSPRCWNHKLMKKLCSVDFTQSSADPCIVVNTAVSLTITAVYLDNLILAAEDLDEMIAVKWELSSGFKMKDMGELHLFLGMGAERGEVQRHDQPIQQTQYVK